MRIAFELSAEPRNDQGKGASRRLRHSGKVPAILYGAHAEPTRRVLEHEKIRLHLPIHFRGEAAAPGIKTQGGVVSHHMADMEVVCLPKDLPEHIELDLSGMSLNDTLYVSDIKVPPGVTISALAHGANPPVVSIHAPRVAEPEPEAVEAAAAAA